MTDRSTTRQQQLDFMLPPGEAARRQRIRSIRHHFFCLLECLLDRGIPGRSRGEVRAVIRTLKRLLKSDVTRWDGGGTFRCNRIASDWMVGDRTLRRHLAAANQMGLIETTIDTDERAIRRTTIEFNWRAIAALVGADPLPQQPATVTEQPATVTEQPATVTEQPATVTEQPAMVAEYSGTGTPVAPAASGRSRSWSAAAAEILVIAPELSLACLQAAREAGCAPAEALAIARYWQSRPGVWGVGALFCRLRRAIPGVSADQGWPAERSTRPRRSDAIQADPSTELSIRISRLVKAGRREGRSESEIDAAISKLESKFFAETTGARQ